MHYFEENSIFTRNIKFSSGKLNFHDEKKISVAKKGFS